ncbi:NUDIX hydrolase [Roseomonas sp. 18066]|uniref:NUDIX hydrolase n=1 Tax=Roseomonas sp. 18066 TaxID=2681412 RepID=UPI001F1589A0|nr:NUDIX hydrolase [Roseomonas sp. 18066]
MADKTLGGRQYAALPLRRQGPELQVMLLTSRRTRRWVLPKGWAEPGLCPHELAAKEAFEEAGLRGRMELLSVGEYHYDKELRDGRFVPCTVGVFPLWVEHQLEDWPERAERETEWFSLAEAADRVIEPELAVLLRDFSL